MGCQTEARWGECRTHRSSCSITMSTAAVRSGTPSCSSEGEGKLNTPGHVELHLAAAPPILPVPRAPQMVPSQGIVEPQQQSGLGGAGNRENFAGTAPSRERT